MRVLTAAIWLLLGLGVIGTGLLLVHGLGGGGWTGVGIGGPILLASGSVLFCVRLALGEDEDSRFADAPLALGTVVGLDRTGPAVNGSLRLELVMTVDTPDGRRFRASTCAVVPKAMLPRVRVGAVLPVRYRPDSAEHQVMLAADVGQQEIRKVSDQVRIARRERPTPTGADRRASGARPRCAPRACIPPRFQGTWSRSRESWATRPCGSGFLAEQCKSITTAAVRARIVRGASWWVGDRRGGWCQPGADLGQGFGEQ